MNVLNRKKCVKSSFTTSVRNKWDKERDGWIAEIKETEDERNQRRPRWWPSCCSRKPTLQANIRFSIKTRAGFIFTLAYIIPEGIDSLERDVSVLDEPNSPPTSFLLSFFSSTSYLKSEINHFYFFEKIVTVFLKTLWWSYR